MAAAHDRLEWVDDGTGVAHRIPERGTVEFRLGDQLVVRDDQAAVIVHEGRGLDVFGPGRHTFQSVNLPVLTRVLKLPAGYRSAIRATVYFVTMRPVAGVPWGGPVDAKDPVAGRVTLRAAGTMRLRIVQPLLFVNQVIGLRRVEPPDILSFLGALAPAALRSLVEEAGVAAVPQAPAEVAAGLKARTAEGMLKLGVELQKLAVPDFDVPREAAAAAPEPAASPWATGRTRGEGESKFGAPFGLMTPGLALERTRRGDEGAEGIHERRVVTC